jgi:hypothetical protein
MAPWWWFLCEPKHVGVNVGILIVLIFLLFYNCVHHCGKKKCFDIVDARYKHEEKHNLFLLPTSPICCPKNTGIIKSHFSNSYCLKLYYLLHQSDTDNFSLWRRHTDREVKFPQDCQTLTTRLWFLASNGEEVNEIVTICLVTSNLMQKLMAL